MKWLDNEDVKQAIPCSMRLLLTMCRDVSSSIAHVAEQLVVGLNHLESHPTIIDTVSPALGRKGVMTIRGELYEESVLNSCVLCLQTMMDPS